jgi:hypothetical protein
MRPIEPKPVRCWMLLLRLCRGIGIVSSLAEEAALSMDSAATTRKRKPDRMSST